MEFGHSSPSSILTGLNGLTGLPLFPLSVQEWHLEAGPNS